MDNSIICMQYGIAYRKPRSNINISKRVKWVLCDHYITLSFSFVPLLPHHLDLFSKLWALCMSCHHTCIV